MSDQLHRTDRRRRRKVLVFLASHVLVAAATGAIVYGVTHDSGARSGALTLQDGKTLQLSGVYAVGEDLMTGKSPLVGMTLTVPTTNKYQVVGSEVEVSISVETGCIAFGTQTKRFANLAWKGLDAISRDTYFPISPITQIIWTFDGVATNVCIDSTYWVKARVITDDGVASDWSAAWLVKATAP